MADGVFVMPGTGSKTRERSRSRHDREVST
jgi:hypothetical protein